MAGLKLPKRLDIYLTDYPVVATSTLQPDDVTSPRVFVWGTNPTVTVLTIVTLNDVSMHVERCRLDKRIERTNVLVPLRNEKSIDMATETRSILNIG
jgi:hypothetical protein